MPCLPESGGCEKPFTDAFAEYLNRAEGTRYVYRECLDIADRKHPQPEALYIDSERSLQLVIERKSISWPVDYAHRHSNDHFVSEVFSKEMESLQLDDLYEFRVPMLIEGTQPELRSFVQRAARKIRLHWAKVAAGRILRERVSEKWWWTFRRVPASEREDEAPSKGWQFTFEGQASSRFDPLDATNLPADLILALQKIYSSCVKKFNLHTHSRRVLVLDLYEDLRDQPVDWWHDVFSASPPPVEIEEIWSGVFGWNEAGSQAWVFERLR
jgi:hypothetical protein